MKVDSKILLATDQYLTRAFSTLFPSWENVAVRLQSDKENKELLSVSKRLGDICERIEQCRSIVIDLTLLSRPEINSVLLEKLKKIPQ